MDLTPPPSSPSYPPVAAPKSGARCGAPCPYMVSHESALIALTPRVKSSWASVKARFSNSASATRDEGYEKTSA